MCAFLFFSMFDISVSSGIMGDRVGGYKVGRDEAPKCIEVVQNLTNLLHGNIIKTWTVK